MAIKSEPFKVRGWLMQIWKQEIVLFNMLEYEDCKMNIRKFRKICTAQNGIKM